MLKGAETGIMTHMCWYSVYVQINVASLWLTHAGTQINVVLTYFPQSIIIMKILFCNYTTCENNKLLSVFDLLTNKKPYTVYT